MRLRAATLPDRSPDGPVRPAPFSAASHSPLVGVLGADRRVVVVSVRRLLASGLLTASKVFRAAGISLLRSYYDNSSTEAELDRAVYDNSGVVRYSVNCSGDPAAAARTMERAWRRRTLASHRGGAFN